MSYPRYSRSPYFRIGGVGCGYRFCGYIQFNLANLFIKIVPSKCIEDVPNDAFYSISNYSDATATIKNVSLAGATVTPFTVQHEHYADRGTTDKVIAMGTPGGDNVSSVGNFCRALCSTMAFCLCSMQPG